MSTEEKIKNKKQQRVSYKDALVIKDKLIMDFKNPTQNAISYVEDYAGGSDSFINNSIVDDLIRKLTR